MTRGELKEWAKGKIKGHIWELLVPILVAGLLTGLTIGAKANYTDGKFEYFAGYNLGFFLYFVEVGLTYFMVQFINDKEYAFSDLFKFAKDYVRIFVVNLLQCIFVFLWTLLLIVPGIIKGFAYSLVSFLLADEKYSDLGYMDVLKKSDEMMKGHKMDLFVFELSYIGWWILAGFTLGILCIWLVPYYTTAKYKFLNDIKTGYEK